MPITCKCCNVLCLPCEFMSRTPIVQVTLKNQYTHDGSPNPTQGLTNWLDFTVGMVNSNPVTLNQYSNFSKTWHQGWHVDNSYSGSIGVWDSFTAQYFYFNVASSMYTVFYFVYPDDEPCNPLHTVFLAALFDSVSPATTAYNFMLNRWVLLYGSNYDPPSNPSINSNYYLMSNTFPFEPPLHYPQYSDYYYFRLKNCSQLSEADLIRTGAFPWQPPSVISLPVSVVVT